MNDDRAMLMFTRLAVASARRGQRQGRDRFLILSGIAAARYGCSDVAACCHQLVTNESPRHLLSRYASFADALRDPDFAPFAKQLQRFCSVERAEHLLAQLGNSIADSEQKSACEAALVELARIAE